MSTENSRVCHVIVSNPNAHRELLELCQRWQRREPNSCFVDWEQSLLSYQAPAAPPEGWVAEVVECLQILTHMGPYIDDEAIQRHPQYEEYVRCQTGILFAKWLARRLLERKP